MPPQHVAGEGLGPLVMPSDVQLRFERLCAIQSMELETACLAQGIMPSMLALRVRSDSLVSSRVVLDDAFAFLAPPASADRYPSSQPIRAKRRRRQLGTVDFLESPDSGLANDLARALLLHLEAPCTYQPSGLLPVVPGKDAQLLSQASPVPSTIPPTKVLGPAAHSAFNGLSKAANAVDERDLGFAQHLARDVAIRFEQLPGKHRRDSGCDSSSDDASCKGPGNPPNPMRRSRKRSHGDDVDEALAKNPYVNAFAAQQGGRLDQRREKSLSPGRDHGSRGELGGFRTAASKLAAQRRKQGFRDPAKRPPDPRVQETASCLHGKRNCSGRRSEPDSGTRAMTSAVLGSARRSRLSATGTGQSALARNGKVEEVRPVGPNGEELPEIPNVEPRLVEMIMNDMLDKSPEVDWDDIAGLHFAKRCVMEAVVWPMKRPDIFTGLRGPPKGLLLFGPPGTGKTLIGRAIASKSGAQFFNISASSLMSKWVGEGEKMVRALFSVARVLQPSVVFIDEIDSLLTQRTDGDQESSRRVKTEFLVQMDGAGTSRDDRVLVVGATNRPAELDEAARRRLVKRLYIPLPDDDARASLVRRVLMQQRHDLQSTSEVNAVVELTRGYSGSDLYALCAEAALGPVRDLGESIGTIDAGSVRPITLRDFEVAARMVRASVSEGDLDGYLDWNKTFGSFPVEEVERGQKD